MKRIPSIDIARGIVMIIMALDHTRDYLDSWSQTHNPTDLATTTPLEFLTRWITHFCAPAFVFLAGASAAIQLNRAQDPRETRRWLIRRGLVLIAIEFTLVNFGLTFDPKFRLLLFEVIATIGTSGILAALLSRLPFRWLLILTALIFFGHDLLPLPQAMAMGAQGPSLSSSILRTVGWSPGAFQPSPRLLIVIAYPVLPWLGILLTGFVAARWFERPAAERRRLFLGSGLIAIGLFLLLRFINTYGDPAPWAAQKTPLFTLLSFLNVTKYAPSLLYSLLTLGVLSLILAAVEKPAAPAAQTPSPAAPSATPQPPSLPTRILLTYGRTPLFYFVIHIYIIHLLMLAINLAHGFSFSQLDFSAFQFGRPPGGGGLPTAFTYPIWLAVVIILYPLCRWYGRYKTSHPELKFLRYF